MYSNTFLTQAYKSGHIHTWTTATGKQKAQAQLNGELKEFPTFTGCQRWITKKLKEQENADTQTRNY